MPSSPVRVAMLISGGGRSALNLHAAFQRHAVDAITTIVIAHREEVSGVAHCRAAGMPVIIVPRDTPVLDDSIDRALEGANAELICLAGYLRKFRVGTRWTNRVLNMHPALLPAFGGKGMFGMHVHEAVLAAGRTETGCTVHLVDEEYDHGETIAQTRVPVLKGDTPESLAERVFTAECIAYPEAVALWIANAKFPNHARK